MKKRLLILFVLSIFYQSWGQNEKPHRESFHLELAVDSLQYYSQDVEKTPYFVKDLILQIYPSEKIFVETTIHNDTIVAMKSVKENLHPEKTIVIDFQQNTDGREHDFMMMSISNPFDKALTYFAHKYTVGGENWTSTSTIPVSPGLISYESWPDVIITLVLDNWKLSTQKKD